VSQCKVAVFHPGTQHSWQTAQALQELGLLAFYATSIHYDPDRWPYRLARLPGPVGRRFHKEFSRFAAQGLDPLLIRTGGSHEWYERIAMRAGLPRLARALDQAGNRAFARVVGHQIAKENPPILWGYDYSSLDTFREAKRGGMACVLDVTVGHRAMLNRILVDLAEEWPDWVSGHAPIATSAMLERFEEELALADVVLAGSNFAADTLRQHGSHLDLAAKLRVLPYCWDDSLFASQPVPRPPSPNEPIRFLFVGQVGLRKGAHLLLNAIANLPRELASLTLLGSLGIPKNTFARFSDRVTHIPSVPRHAVPEIMASHHVLVLPSYFEGSSVALIEGLASGLALIQTRAAGNGVTEQTGIMLEEMTVAALTDAMHSAAGDRVRLQAWRDAAQMESRRYSSACYRDGIAAILDNDFESTGISE